MVVSVHNVIVSSEARFLPMEITEIATQEVRILSPNVFWRFTPDALTFVVSYQIRTREEKKNRDSPFHQAFAAGLIGVDWGIYGPPSYADWLRLFEPGISKRLDAMLSRSQVAFISEPLPWTLPDGSYVVKDPSIYGASQGEIADYYRRQLTKPPRTIEGKVTGPKLGNQKITHTKK